MKPPPPSQVIVDRASPAAEESRRLVAELWLEIDQLYDNDVSTVPDQSESDRSGSAFVIARQDGIAVGCGALRPRTRSIAEVKRVYVRPQARRTGAARAIMAALEQLARETGFNEIWLETGLRQPAAIRLYESLGYTRIADFGDYKDDPLSVCYGKRLT